MVDLPGIPQVTEAAAFGRVAVLFGGRSAEREVSLRSGTAVLAALRRRRVDAHGVDAAGDVIGALRSGGFDRVFVALHGRGGEDGVIQGALETLGVPYTGSGVLGCALSMDKLRCKQLWRGLGLPTPEWALLPATGNPGEAVRELGLPLMVKPVREGSSVGAAKVTEAGQLAAARDAAVRYGEVLAERWIEGAEYTAAILGTRVLPLIRLETPRTFYDYEAKYHADDTRYHCPCGLAPDEEARLADLAMEAFRTIGASGWGRVDLMVDRAGRPWLLEVNTVPGMTDHSLVPMAAHAAGIGFDDLVWAILATSMEEGA